MPHATKWKGEANGLTWVTDGPRGCRVVAVGRGHGVRTPALRRRQAVPVEFRREGSPDRFSCVLVVAGSGAGEVVAEGVAVG